MGYSNVALKDTIMNMYPDITKHRISVNLVFNQELNTFDVKLKKDHHELSTHIDKKDADECMDGVKCIHLGVQVGEFIRNFEAGE